MGNVFHCQGAFSCTVGAGVWLCVCSGTVRYEEQIGLENNHRDAKVLEVIASAVVLGRCHTVKRAQRLCVWGGC